jgi:hypothetical protein
MEELYPTCEEPAGIFWKEIAQDEVMELIIINLMELDSDSPDSDNIY